VTRVGGVEEHRTFCVEFCTCQVLIIFSELMTIVIDHTVDFGARSLEIPEVDAALICSEEVLAVGAHRHRVKVMLLSGLEGIHKLALLGDASDLGPGQTEALTLGDLSFD